LSSRLAPHAESHLAGAALVAGHLVTVAVEAAAEVVLEVVAAVVVAGLVVLSEGSVV